MPLPRSIHFEWSYHARVRELERIDSGVSLPDAGSYVRLLYLGIVDGTDRWLYAIDGCYVYGLVIPAAHHDVFLIRTVIRRTRTLWNAPLKVALYQLEANRAVSKYRWPSRVDEFVIVRFIQDRMLVHRTGGSCS